MANEEAKVNTPCLAYSAMASKWGLIDDLMGGTSAMQANAATYLPQFDKEEPKHYAARVNRSRLFNAFGDTVKSIVSKPFSKPVTLQGEVPEQLQPLEDDTDGMGKSLGQLAKEIFEQFVTRGLGHILVDYPITVADDGNKPNLAQERRAGFRPKLIQIKPTQLIAWRTERDSSGKEVLTQIRIAETRTEPTGDWGEKQVDYVRVIERDSYFLYRKTESQGGDEYIRVEEGVNSLGKVPLVTGYANQSGYLTAEPPLMDLAETNRAHFQSESDQRSILHMARTVTLFAKGFTEDEAAKIALGPNQRISTTNENADVKFVEHTGQAIAAGAKDLSDLKEEMVMLGLQPFTRTTGVTTATGQSIDESRANSDVQAWVMSLEDLLYNAYLMAAEWIKVTLPDDFKANVFNDFALWLRAVQDIEHLIKIRQAGELSRKTFLQEVRRRGLLSETVVIEEEILDIETEGPSLGEITAAGLGGIPAPGSEE